MSTDTRFPLTPSNADLRDFPYLPLDIARLFGSQFHARANDAEWRAGVTLWLKSFHQVPAASLPDDELALARLAELGPNVKVWRKVAKVALHGWLKASDGRLYHPVVAVKALDAWIAKLAQRKSSAAGHAKRWGGTSDSSDLDRQIEAATAMLLVLNPQSRTLRKPMKKPPPDGGVGDAGGTAIGNANGTAERLPSACQEKGREEIESSSSSGARASFDHLDAWLRTLVGEEPVLVDPDVQPIIDAMAAGATHADVEAGIAAAMAAPRFRPRSWDQLVGWIRHATKDRLAVSPKVVAVRGASAAETTSSNPNIELMREYHQQMMEERHGAERPDSRSPVFELFAAERRHA